MCNFSAIREYDFMKFIKYLLLLVFILGGLPVSQTWDLRAESASEETKKKKRKKKKKSSRKKSSSSKKESSSKSKKKKRRKQKKRPAEETKSEKTESSEVDNDSDKSAAKKDRFNSTAYADELFNLTGELQASNKELARATRYFYDNEPKKANGCH